MYNNIKKRLDRAAENIRNNEEPPIIRRLIADGAFYDELNDNEKTAYCEYLGFSRDVVEDIQEAAGASLRFKIERKPRQATTAELMAAVEDVGNIIENLN